MKHTKLLGLLCVRRKTDQERLGWRGGKLPAPGWAVETRKAKLIASCRRLRPIKVGRFGLRQSSEL